MKPQPRWADPVLWVAFFAGLMLRWTPHAVWGLGPPIRDEAIYLQIARRITAGGGMGAPKSWLWAPGYPYTIAFFREYVPFGATWALPWAQGLLGAACCIAMYWLCFRVHGDRSSARWGAWLYALHPTLVFFTGRLWCEAIYGPMLLLAVLSVLWARDGRWYRALLPGVILGLCVLTRGVATYLAPIFVVAALWPEEPEGGRLASVKRRYPHALGMLVAAALVVAPYSMQASKRYGKFVLNDATLGNLMFLGNNDFPPMTFDYGNGTLRDLARFKSTRHGRRHCKNAEDPIEWNKCETERGMAWIRANPGEFVRRMPLRVAQMLNPHSFATRSLRWARYRGIPFWAKEALIVWIAAWSFLVMLGGSIGATARSKGPYAWMAWTIVLYTIGASAATYGLTRFRLPLEPLWMVFLAAFLAHPRATIEAIRADRRRLVATAVLLPLVLVHLLWFLPSGWPGWNW